MQTMSLNGAWQLLRSSTGDKFPAVVPGVVHTDLLAAGVIEDPYYRDNERALAWIGAEDWRYERDFQVEQEFLNHHALRLIFDGLDTFATVRLNDIVIGQSDNMFRRYEYDVKDILHAGTNQLEVVFASPIKKASEIASRIPYHIPYTGETEWYITHTHRNLIRKCQCHAGWDWGPAFLTMGIWKDVSLVAYDQLRIRGVKPIQFHDAGHVRLQVCIDLDVAEAGCYAISLFIAGHTKTGQFNLDNGKRQVSMEITLNEPALWWPLGHGPQNLHTLIVSIKFRGKVIAETNRRLGLRKVQLVQEADPHGQSFYFKINDRPVFLKGFNWIPVDAFTSRMAPEVYTDLIDSAVQANCNILRVWGGGIYEHDAFYDHCDELGIMVWQDFMFACAMYPWDDAFLANVAQEVKEQIWRLAPHPSLVLWCGNNECEMALDWYPESRKKRSFFHAGYHRLFMDTIGAIACQEAPDLPYWPSSPSNGPGVYGDCNARSQGDTHYWEVWHGGKPFNEYLTVLPRMSSEYGFQSVPSLETLKPVLSAGDFDIASPMMDYRQRSAIGNRAIVKHMMSEYLPPNDFEQFIYLSQVQQAMAMKIATEHWRRLLPVNMGTIIWQLNDIWPGNAWSSIEYGGKWKVLHSFTKRFFAPLLLSIAQKNGRVEVWATNDGPEPAQGAFALEVRDLIGNIQQQWSVEYHVDPLQSLPCLSLELKTLKRIAPLAHIFLVLQQKGSPILDWTFLTHAKDCPLPTPQVEIRTKEVDGKTIIELHTDYPVFHLWLDIPGRRGTFDDNGFLLLPDRPKHVVFSPKDDLGPVNPEQIHLFHLEDAMNHHRLATSPFKTLVKRLTKVFGFC